MRRKMSKTAETKKCEKAIYRATANKIGVYGCFECTLGAGYGNERVDFITMDSRNTFRCYEIKVSVSDFNSHAKKSFCGDFNYFVMPEALYYELEDKSLLDPYLISGVGVYAVNDDASVVVKAKNKNIPLHRKVELMHAMVRSLSRRTRIGE